MIEPASTLRVCPPPNAAQSNWDGPYKGSYWLGPEIHFERPVAWVKLRYAAALAFLLLTSCGSTIQQSKTRAQIAAARAERSADHAGQAATQAWRASIRVGRLADDADEQVRRANDAVSKLEAPTIAHGDLLVSPTVGLPTRWCLMGPPIFQGCPDCSESVEWHAPRSRFWVGEIFDSKRDCHTALQKFHRRFLRSGGKALPFRSFCAACANGADDDAD